MFPNLNTYGKIYKTVHFLPFLYPYIRYKTRKYICYILQLETDEKVYCIGSNGLYHNSKTSIGKTIDSICQTYFLLFLVNMSFLIIGVMGYVEDEKEIFQGVKGAGKDTIVDTWMEKYSTPETVLKIALADKMKNILVDRYRISKSDQESIGKERFLDLPSRPEASFRDLCIWLGTSVVRTELKLDKFWIHYVDKKIQSFVKTFEDELCEYSGLHMDMVKNTITKHMPDWKDGQRKIVFIPDIRFYNEYKYFKNKYGDNCRMIMVKRQTKTVTITQQDAHISNQYDPLMVPDCVIDNDSTPMDMAERLHGYMSEA